LFGGRPTQQNKKTAAAPNWPSLAERSEPAPIKSAPTNARNARWLSFAFNVTLAGAPAQSVKGTAVTNFARSALGRAGCSGALGVARGARSVGGPLPYHLDGREFQPSRTPKPAVHENSFNATSLNEKPEAARTAFIAQPKRPAHHPPGAAPGSNIALRAKKHHRHQHLRRTTLEATTRTRVRIGRRNPNGKRPARQ